jgi:RNA polymerase sigma factor (sigma-70 family)
LENIVQYIENCRQGNDYARKWMYEQYRGFALKTVFRYIYRYENAVDVVNDGFVKIFNHFDQFRVENIQDAEKVLMGWIKRIMIHTAIDELRKNKMTPEIGGIPDHVWHMSEKTDEADQQALYKDVIEMVKNLPPLYRSIFNLYVIDGYNHIEIAELLKIPVGTSKSGLSRARILLQQKILKLEDISYAVSG